MTGGPTRRTLLRLAYGMLLAASAASAQEPGVYRLGGLHSSTRGAPHWIAFFGELRRLGFIEGQNLSDDPQGYGLRAEQFDEHAAESPA